MAAPAAISQVAYGWEAVAFGTAAVTIDKAFGHGVKITSLQRKNNVEKILSMGARNAQRLVAKLFEGTATFEFVLANPWILRAIIGAAPVTTGSGPYTHTYTESDTVDSFTALNQVNTDTKSTSLLRGCKVATAVITCAVNEVVRVRLDCPFVNETADSSSNSLISDSLEPFFFAQGTLELPNGTTRAYVQSAELTIGNNPQVVGGMGSRLGQAAPVKNREYMISASMAFSDDTKTLDLLYGAAAGPQSSITETATLKLTFTNGLATTSTRSITFSFTGVVLDEHNLPQDPTSLVMENWTAAMRAVNVVAVNNTSTAP